MAANLELGTVKVSTAFRVVASVGAFASTIILALIGVTYQTVASEWRSLRSEINEIREEQKKSTKSEEFVKLRDKVDDINERVIRIEESLSP